MSNRIATLYVVATPIGNLGDMGPRAIATLAEVALIAAEDTRHSAPLLRHFGIRTPLLALHEHNERQRTEALVERLLGGESIALISDAGTPLVSDPGFPLVRAARAAGVPVVPLPGPCAAVAALSVAGIPSDRFVFEGFLPPKGAARRSRLQQLAGERRTLLFYESSHRIEEALADMEEQLGEGREVVMARELTKLHETIHGDTLAGLRRFVAADPNQRKGEFVLVVAGAPAAAEGAGEVGVEARRVLELLLEELPVKQAAALAARISGARRKPLYQLALSLKENAD